MVKELTDKQKAYFKKMFNITETTVKASSKKPVNVVIKKDPKKKRKPEGILRLFPPIKFIPLVYSEQFELFTDTTKDNFGVEKIFRLNSIVGPNVAGGNKPQGYDQMAAVYGRYKVYSSRVHITFSNPSQKGLVIGCRIEESGGTVSLTGQREGTSDMQKWTVCKPISSSGEQKVTYDRYMDIQKIDGQNKTQFVGDKGDYIANMGANPVKSPWLRLAVLNTEDTTNAKVIAKISITYYTQFNDRQILATST